MSGTRVPPSAPPQLVKIEKGMGVGVAPKGTGPVIPQRQGVETLPRRMVVVPGHGTFQGGMGVAVAPKTVNGAPQTVVVAVEIAPAKAPQSEPPRNAASGDGASSMPKKAP